MDPRFKLKKERKNVTVNIPQLTQLSLIKYHRLIPTTVHNRVKLQVACLVLARR